jgi:DNA polymerase-1
VRPEGGPGSLFIFDGYNFIFRAYHALPMLNAADGRPVNAVHGFVRMVQAARREFAPELMVAVFDAGGDGHRRRDFKDYKAQRPAPPDDLIPQFRLVRDATDALGIARVEHPEYEADDLIAGYVRHAQDEGMRVVIVSSDKDLMQLVHLGDGKPSVLLWDTMKSKTLGPAEVEEKFGVGPDRLGDLLALTGDSSDNIPGVPGIGPKTAAELLNAYGDLEGVLSHASEIKQQKRRERLLEHADNARLSRRLVELRGEVPLPKPLSELRDHGSDDDRVIAFFEPLGFKQVLREIGASGRARAAEAPVGGSAPVAVDDPGALELVPVPGFTVHPDRYRVLMADDAAALAEFCTRLAQADTLALFVAAHGDEPLFAEVVGLSICALRKTDGAIDAVYVPFGHRQADLVAGQQLGRSEALAAIAPLLEDPGLPKVVWGFKAATHALATVGIALRGVSLDPMLASYVLDPARTSHDLDALSRDVLGHSLGTSDGLTGKGRKYTALCDLDVAPVGTWMCERGEVALGLGEALGQQIEGAADATRRLLEQVEMPLATVLAQIERRGIAVDVGVLHQQSGELEVQIADIARRVEAQAGYAVNLDSPIQLRKLLFEERGLPPGRKTKTGYSTDARALEELSLLDPIVGDILRYRSAVKLKNTYLDALPQLVRPDTGRLHTSFHQAVAATGRLSSSDPNLQNIPIRSDEGRRIRQAFVAPPGRMLVALDYSQIELRILAHLSGDPNLTSAFIDGVDVHRRTAAEVFEVPEDAVTDEQRRIAKAVNFGVVYGQTAFGLAQQLGIPRGKAGSYIRTYFEKVPGVDRYMRELIEVARVRGYAETIMGRRRRIPELGRKGAARSHGERIARNTPIQGSAADILKVAMIAVEGRLGPEPWADMLLTVHDELIFECDEDRVQDLVTLCRPLMQGAAQLSVPLVVDAGWGVNWATAKG